jgi:hypothetical protein
MSVLTSLPPIPPPILIPLLPPPLTTLPPLLEFSVIGANDIALWVDIVNIGEGRIVYGWNSLSCLDMINTLFPTIPTSSSNCKEV